ncbi:SUMO-interacting motif-containing protein 1 isoform X3 [Caloenas nicobarica]|uniref:SUMO-interacting motif-containing protein 1 isoform X3 n=1 Tax=Caloenas nicobarica TaxID=187106 RepID=UPI0032B843D7
MADSVILISDSDAEGSRSPPPGLPRRCPPLPASPQEIIDLTCEDMSTEPAPWSSLTIIDLTEDTCSPPHTISWADQDPGQPPATLAADTSHPQLCSPTTQEMGATAGLSLAATWHSTPVEPSATTDTAETTENWSCFSSASSHRSSSSSPEQNCSTTTFNSDLGSLASMQLDSDLLSPSPSSPDSSSSWRSGGPEKKTPHLRQQRELPPRLSPAPAIPARPGEVQGPLLAASDLSPHGTIQQVTAARTKADSKAWLNKLHYFRRSGVQHLFLQGVAPNWETEQRKPELIPSGKLSMVHTTMEENFLEGTVHFLSEFVSCQHCPPKEIISHLIREILLNPHHGEILKDTYMLLMKIQMLHPANATTVGWDWALLKYTMEDQVLGTMCNIGQGSSSTQCPREKPPGRLLFLQYVVQTLEDDFQQNLRLRLLQKSIAKKVLSCDMCFNNVKVMLLLQRMLSIAVEVDKSPNCSSCKIADVIFPFILNIPLRSQREAFLNTMESQLLRCKLLELWFQHSCDVPTTLPLSLAKILYFLSHSSVLLQYQEEMATWQRWDEMLQYLSLLLLSYQNVILEHLRTSLNERMDLIIQKVKPRLQDSDDISHLDIQLKIEDFISRMQQVLGQPFPLQIMEKLYMLQELFLIVTAT